MKMMDGSPLVRLAAPVCKEKTVRLAGFHVNNKPLCRVRRVATAP
jgi:hypothetical protein